MVKMADCERSSSSNYVHTEEGWQCDLMYGMLTD